MPLYFCDVRMRAGRERVCIARSLHADVQSLRMWSEEQLLLQDGKISRACHSILLLLIFS